MDNDIQHRLELLVQYHGQLLGEEKHLLSTLASLLSVAIAIGGGVVAFLAVFSTSARLESINPWLIGSLPIVGLSPLGWATSIEAKLQVVRHMLREAELEFLRLSPSADAGPTRHPPPLGYANRSLQRQSPTTTGPATRGHRLAATADRISISAIEWSGPFINMVAFGAVAVIALIASASGVVQTVMGGAYAVMAAIFAWVSFRVHRTDVIESIMDTIWEKVRDDLHSEPAVWRSGDR